MVCVIILYHYTVFGKCRKSIVFYDYITTLLQEDEKVDENYQPLVSRTKAAVMAGWFFTQLDMNIQWPLFEKLWHRESMRSDHSKGMKQKKTSDFQDRLKSIEKKLEEEKSQVQLAAQLPRS